VGVASGARARTGRPATCPVDHFSRCVLVTVLPGTPNTPANINLGCPLDGLLIPLAIIMRIAFFVALAAFAPLAVARLDCVVKGLGGGQDDGPNILAAFKRCKSNGKITLADYYSVDTLLLVTGLNDVEIELTGTRM
jgi:hypothetical protein